MYHNGFPVSPLSLMEKKIFTHGNPVLCQGESELASPHLFQNAGRHNKQQPPPPNPRFKGRFKRCVPVTVGQMVTKPLAFWRETGAGLLLWHWLFRGI